MKKSFLILLFFSLISCYSASAQTKFMQITTIESTVEGGIGRSKMIITKEDGSSEEKDMNNLFSLLGINFKNIKSNEADVLNVLKSYANDGWKIVSVTPLTISPSPTTTVGLFMTRYLLSK